MSTRTLNTAHDHKHGRFRATTNIPSLGYHRHPVSNNKRLSNDTTHRDQLSPGNETRVWTAGEEKTPCEARLGSEYSPEMQ